MPSPDRAILRLARTRGHTPASDSAVRRFSALGEHGGAWLAASLAGAALSPARRPAFLRAARAVAVAYAVNQAVKLAVRRRRPELAGLPRLTHTTSNLSYPSAHASTSFAGARSLARAALPAPPLYALAAALALSRVYLGVHYPTDVVAGAALGLSVAELAA